LSDEDIDTPVSMLFFKDERNDEFSEVILQTVYEKQRVSNSVKSYYLGEEHKQLSITTSYIEEDGKTEVLVVLNDITELYELRDAKVALEKIQTLNKELELAKEEAERANETKSLFLSNMSHEIRTPINAVLGMNEMILREYNDPQLIEYASNIQASGKTLLFLINDILDLSKIESGKMDIIPVNYKLGDILRELYQMISFRAEEKNLALSFEVDETTPAELFGDEVRIKQIVTNILTNAVKYTKKGSVRLQVNYEQTSEDMVKLKISVADTGIGIRKEDMGALFESFRRLDETENRHIEGTGLGMSITLSLLHMMDGSLNVDSEYGKGSVFTVEIPQKITGDEKLGSWEKIRHTAGNATSRAGTFTAPDARILVVDDNPMNLTVVRGLLKRTKVQLETAASGKECLEKVKQEDFDMVFLDHMMPDMDGIETLQRLRKLGSGNSATVPVIALTANAVSGAREMYLEAGFDNFLTKPIDSALLEGMICDYLPKEKIHPAEEAILRSATVEEAEKENKTALPLDEERLHFFKEEYGIDISAAMQFVKQDFSFYQVLLGQYCRQAAERKEKLTEYCRTKDMKQYGILAHAIKGDVRMLGADAFAETAFAHEMAGKNNDQAFVEANLNDFFDAFDKIKTGFEKILEETAEDCAQQEEEKPEISKEQIAKEAEKAMELIDDFMEEKAAEVLKGLLEYSLPQKTKNVLQEAVTAIEKEYDADKALELLKQI
jgi:signal transduction histidine kinase/CheY-like chemotaxis protein